ncbi:hypothetical protein L1D16_19635 [Vibrio sp. Isolate31]|uniref:calcium-binding protein n=1 Tax=Vibrio sp. Isolate31 TaxID=2908537 RepID=UPI001EFCDA3A|nr:hypothetical protein [Vibrio sp. Isolate31]
MAVELYSYSQSNSNDLELLNKKIIGVVGSAALGAGLAKTFIALVGGATAAASIPVAALATLAAAIIAGAIATEVIESDWFNDLYDSAYDSLQGLFGWQPTPPPRRDPLILDLDGNGVSLTESTYFDHNANGIANRTEWVSSSDGLLVLDRDGNGTIDSGRELFGDNTLVVNGNTASDGYAALEVYDLNSDNVIDTGDEVFDQLKVWVDENSDGVSQEYELKTLSSLGIKSIDLNHENLHSQYSDVQGESHSTQSVILDTSNFDRRFVESLEVPDSFNGLPNMRGTGTVRDLHEAMTLSSQLKDKVEKLSTSSTREEQLDLTGEILFSWAKTSQYYDEHIPVFSGPAIDKVYAIEAFYGEKVPWSVSFGTNGASMALPTEFINSAYDSLIKMIYSELASQTRLKDYYDAITITSDESGLILSLEGALTQFSERTLNPALIADAMDFMSAMSSTSNIELTGFYTFISNALYGASGSDIEQLQSALEFNGIAISEVEGIKKVTFDDGSITFTEGTSTTEIIGSIRSDQISGTDLDDVIHAGSGNDTVLSGDGNDELHGQDGNDILRGGEGNDILTVNGRGSNTLNGGAGDDTLKVNRSTNYTYQRDVARYAENTLEGGVGNDRLEGSAGAETYVFNRGDGSDTINDYDYKTYYMNGWDKTDRIILGEGITREELRIRRDGNDMVLMIGGIDSGDSITIENSATDGRYQIEEIALADGTTVTPQEIPLYVVEGDNDIHGSDLVAETIVVGSGHDHIRSEGGDDIIDAGSGNNTVDAGAGNDNVTTGDGSDTVMAGTGNDQVVVGAGNDEVKAGSGNDIVYGEEGNDELHGQDGNDQLFGGEGDDLITVNGRGSNTLNGGAGDDTLKVNRSTNYTYQRDVARYAENTLEGGVGNDRLEGSAGAETYVFNRGDGSDTINDYDYKTYYMNGWDKTDRIILGEGITREELRIRRDGNHMVLLIGGPDSGDSITIENAYSDSRYCIEEVVLSDGATFSPLDLQEYSEVETDLLVQAMSSFDSSDSSLSIPTVEANVEELSSPLVVNNQN